MHCILKKKYINQYTTKIRNFLFFYSFFFFPMCGAEILQSTWDGKHQSKHMNLRHVNILSQSYIGNTALLYTFKTKMGCSKTGCQFRDRWVKKPPRTLTCWMLLTMVWFGNGAEGSEKSCAPQNLLRKKLFLWVSFSRIKGKDRLLLENGLVCSHAVPFPTDSCVIMVLPKTIKKTHTKMILPTP